MGRFFLRFMDAGTPPSASAYRITSLGGYGAEERILEVMEGRQKAGNTRMIGDSTGISLDNVVSRLELLLSAKRGWSRL